MTQLAPAGRATSPGTESLGGRLPSLTGLRWAAAFLVFGMHIRNFGFFGPGPAANVMATVFQAGGTGVSFFFILSGFVLMWSSRPKDTALGFLRRRVARIYPVHLVCGAIALVLALTIGSEFVPTVGQLVANVLLLHSWFPDYFYYQSLDPVSWSLVCELLFYVSFPLFGRLARHLQARGAVVFAVVSALSVIAVPIAITVHPTSWPVYFLPLARLGEFTLGIALARLVMLGRWRGPGLDVALGVTLIGYFVVPALPSAFGNTFCTLLGFSLLIPAAAMADLRGTHSVWRLPVMERLGEWSFSFYMVHAMVLGAVKTLLPGTISLNAPVALVVVLAMFGVSLGLSWALYTFVETPGRKFITGGRRKRAKTAPSPA
ncbi:MAG TPA: acyltransferase [Kutzneria sp.]